jgi:hypothetical protein
VICGQRKTYQARYHEVDFLQIRGRGLQDDDDLTGMLYYAYDYGCWFSYDLINLAIDMCKPSTISIIRAMSSSCARQSPLFIVHHAHVWLSPPSAA